MIFSLIIRTATRLLLPLLLLFAIFVLLRGHNLPGGGFVGGLVAASAFALYGFAQGSGEAARMLGVPPRTLLGLGLAFALGSGLLALAGGKAFLTGLWLTIPLPAGHELALGSTLLFDIGVFCVVIGTVLLMVLSIEEDEGLTTEKL